MNNVFVLFCLRNIFSTPLEIHPVKLVDSMWHTNKLQIRKVATSLPCHNNIDIIESFFSVVFLELPSVYIHFMHIYIYI